MARLSSNELMQLRLELAQPMSPAAMQAEVDRLKQRLGYWALVHDTPFRDAFVAAQFARLRGAASVCLSKNPPDFQLFGIPGCDLFEAVETYPEGRLRSNEYRRLAEAHDRCLAFGTGALTEAELTLFKEASDPDDDGQWEARASTASSLLSVAAAKKYNKGYPTDWGLVVLLDLGGFVRDDRVVVAAMQEGTKLARHRFAEVWVLYRGAAWRVWCDGELRMECFSALVDQRTSTAI